MQLRRPIRLRGFPVKLENAGEGARACSKERIIPRHWPGRVVHLFPPHKACLAFHHARFEGLPAKTKPQRQRSRKEAEENGEGDVPLSSVLLALSGHQEMSADEKEKRQHDNTESDQGAAAAAGDDRACGHDEPAQQQQMMAFVPRAGGALQRPPEPKANRPNEIEIG